MVIGDSGGVCDDSIASIIIGTNVFVVLIFYAPKSTSRYSEGSWV